MTCWFIKLVNSPEHEAALISGATVTDWMRSVIHANVINYIIMYTSWSKLLESMFPRKFAVELDCRLAMCWDDFIIAVILSVRYQRLWRCDDHSDNNYFVDFAKSHTLVKGRTSRSMYRPTVWLQRRCSKCSVDVALNRLWQISGGIILATHDGDVMLLWCWWRLLRKKYFSFSTTQNFNRA